MAIVPISTRDPGEQLTALVVQVIELREVLVAMQRCPSLRSPSSLRVLVTKAKRLQSGLDELTVTGDAGRLHPPAPGP